MLVRFVLVCLGIAIGIGFSYLPAAHAQASQGRVVYIPVSSNLEGQIGFIHDTKSNGCWLLAGAAGIATAPATACK
jgi:hypothetical protein